MVCLRLGWWSCERTWLFGLEWSLCVWPLTKLALVEQEISSIEVWMIWLNKESKSEAPWLHS
jgi:hypothetical protein